MGMKQKCRICSKNAYEFKSDLLFLNTLMEKYVYLSNLEKFKNLFLKVINLNPVFKNAHYCKTHLQEMMPLNEFERWTLNYKFSRFYTSICRDEEMYDQDKLLNSLMSFFNLKVPEFNINSELRWFTEEDHYCGIPIEWKQNFVLESYIGVSSKQGNLNGPDFILKNRYTKETIGFEIFELNPTFFYVENGIKNIEKFTEKIDKQINHIRGGNYQRNLNTLRNEIYKKISKWDKFQNTNKKFVGVILNSSAIDEWYYLFENFVKNDLYISEHLDGVLFL